MRIAIHASLHVAFIVAVLAGCAGPSGLRALHPETCPVHGDALLEDEVPYVEGGGPMDTVPPNLRPVVPASEWQPEFEWEAEPKEFPLAHVVKRSGCTWDPREAGRLVHVQYCPTCRIARNRWRLEHPDYARPEFVSEPKSSSNSP